MVGRVFKYKLLNSIVATSNPVYFFYYYFFIYIALGTWVSGGPNMETLDPPIGYYSRYELRSISDFAAGKNL